MILPRFRSRYRAVDEPCYVSTSRKQQEQGSREKEAMDAGVDLTTDFDNSSDLLHVKGNEWHGSTRNGEKRDITSSISKKMSSKIMCIRLLPRQCDSPT